MNKASAVGFAAGMVFLVLVLAFLGLGKAERKTQTTGKPAPAAGEESTGAHEESVETDGGAKPAERKLSNLKPALPEPLRVPGPEGSALRMVRTATPGGYRAGQALDVIVSLDSGSKDKLTALALVERLPKGWTFVEISGGARPVIVPSKGASGELTFVWVQVPTFPCTVSYRIVAGADVAGPQELQGQGVYRQSGPERRTDMIRTTVAPAP